MTLYNVSAASLSDFQDLLKKAGSDREAKPAGTIDWALSTNQDLHGSCEPNIIGVDDKGNFHILRDASLTYRTAVRIAPVEVQVQDGKVSVTTSAASLRNFEIVTNPKDALLAPVDEITIK